MVAEAKNNNNNIGFNKQVISSRALKKVLLEEIRSMTKLTNG